MYNIKVCNLRLGMLWGQEVGCCRAGMGNNGVGMGKLWDRDEEYCGDGDAECSEGGGEECCRGRDGKSYEGGYGMFAVLFNRFTPFILNAIFYVQTGNICP